MKKIFFISCLLLACMQALAQAGAHTINGTVYNERHQAVSGAHLTLAHGKTSVISSENGSFSIAAIALPDTLTVTHINYHNQSVLINANAGNVDITMVENVHQLEEVIVNTGYQQLPKERATGSFTQVSKELFNQQVGTDVISRLDGIANGLSTERKTGTQTLMIRGLSTIIGPKSPLVVIDNFPYDGDINNINPNDVESVTLLKDAAAASIWGARAGNGVIVITTKKAKLNVPLSVEVNSNITVVQKTNLFYLHPIASTDFIDLEKVIFDKGFYTPYINAKLMISPVAELLTKKASGALSAADADAQIDAYRTKDVLREFYDRIYETGIKQQYSLQLRAGTDKYAWLFSGGLDRDLNDLHAAYNRLNLRMQNEIRPFKNARIVTDFYYTQSQALSGKQSYYDVSTASLKLYPYDVLFDANNQPAPITAIFRKAYTDTAGNGHLLDWNYYPADDYKHNTTNTTLSDININITAQYKVLKGLSAEIRYGYEKQLSKTKNLNDINSFFARSFINRYSQLNYATGVVTYKIPKGGVMDILDKSSESNNIRGQLNFDRSFGKHAIVALAGGEFRATDGESVQDRFYGYDDQTKQAALADMVSLFPNFVSGSLATIPSNSGFSGSSSRFVSAFGNAAYTYNGLYTISGSMRRDASNLFGVATNDRWTPLYSTGASWMLSNEKFYHSRLLPYLKLRATYGVSGNIDPSRTAVQTFTNFSISPYTFLTTQNLGTSPNPELQWEHAAMMNIGIDFRTVGNRVSGSIEYYHKTGSKLYGNTPIDPTTGTINVTKNAADMVGNGIDVELNTVNTKGVIGWSSTVNLNWNTDEVTNYYTGTPVSSSIVNLSDIVGTTIYPGHPLLGMFSYKWMGLDPLTGDPQGSLKGAISKDYASIQNAPVSELTYDGPAMPTIFGSLRNTFTFKRLSLSINITGRFHYFFRRPSLAYVPMMSSSGFLSNSDYALRWQKPGDETRTNVPSFVYPASSARDNFYLGSEALIERGDIIKLQYINISWQIDGNMLKHLPFKYIQVYATGSNLGILWRANKYGLDPDYNYGSLAIPPSPQFSVGVRTSL